MVDGYSSFDGEVTTTTTLPAPTWNDIDTTADDEIILGFQREDSNPDGSIEVYRSQTSGTLGTNIASLSPTATSYTDTTANVDDVNYYTLRRVTPDAQADSTQENTLLPPPGISVTTTDSYADLSWADAATTEARYNIYKQPQGGSETQVATLSADSTTYTTDFLVPNSQDYTTFTYRVEAERSGLSSGETTTASEDTTFTLTAIEYGNQYTFVLRHSDGRIRQLTDDLQALDTTLSHTQSSQYSITFARDTTLEDIVSPTTDAFIYNANEELVFRGNAANASSQLSRSTATTTIEGWDTTYLLRQDAGQKTYSNVRVEDAIQDYWDNFTAFSASVTAQSPSTLVDNEVAYSLTSTSDFQGQTTLANDTPLAARNDVLELTQTSWTREGESADRSGGEALRAFDRLSNGSAYALGENGDYVEYDFTPQYDIPAENVGLYVRRETDGNSPEITFSLNGATWSPISDGAVLGVLEWQDYADTTSGGTGSYTGAGGGDLTAGTTYTLRIEATSAESGEFWLDVVAPQDTRFNYTYDNDNGGSSGYLDGPELYPGSVSVGLDRFDQTLNISKVDITGTWDDTSNQQEIAASNDQGTTYLTSSNSTTLTQSFNSVGTTLDVRLTFSRYGSRTTATPQTGFNGQTLSDIEVRYSANDLSVLDSYTVDSDDFTNLQNLHGQGDYVYSMEYDADELLVESFPRGELSKPLDVDVETSQRTLRTRDYYNQVLVRSNLDDTGQRETVTATAPQAELDKYGTVTKTFIKDNLNTRADIESFARTKLRQGLRGDELRGNLSIPPEYVRPGYEYAVDALGGETMTLERVQYSEAPGSLSGSLEFAEEPGLVPAVAAVDASLGDVRDA